MNWMTFQHAILQWQDINVIMITCLKYLHLIMLVKNLLIQKAAITITNMIILASIVPPPLDLNQTKEELDKQIVSLRARVENKL
jgi:hypothetical protein